MNEARAELVLSEEQMRIAVRVLKRNLYASMTGVFLPADSRIEAALREALAECMTLDLCKLEGDR